MERNSLKIMKLLNDNGFTLKDVVDAIPEFISALLLQIADNDRDKAMELLANLAISVSVLMELPTEKEYKMQMENMR